MRGRRVSGHTPYWQAGITPTGEWGGSPTGLGPLQGKWVWGRPGCGAGQGVGQARPCVTLDVS